MRPHTSRDRPRRPRSGAFALLALLPFLAQCASRPATAPRRPNVVIIFTDDQGYADVGVYGAKGFATPNVDRLAAEGVRFTDFYVAQPVCSASRAALLTGCYPNRLGIHGALGPRSRHGIHDDETTLAELLKAEGYATAMFGKWHLGCQPRFLPLRHGFDEFLGIPYSNDMWPLHPDYVNLPPKTAKRKRGYPDLPLIEQDLVSGTRVVNAKITPADQSAFTSSFTARAVDFIQRNKARPFFLYLAHPMPHVPLYTAEAFRGKSAQGRYGDVIEEIDWSVGRVMAALAEAGVDDNTLVIFTSDNGPWLSYGNHAGSTGPLREGKGTTWEGGVRVPCVMRWPGRIPAGRVSREPVMTIDVLPTVAGLVGAPLPRHEIDGRDIWPVIECRDGAKSPHEALYFYYHKNALHAVRAGRWKLVFPHKYRTLAGEGGRDGTPSKYRYPKCGQHLYEHVADIGETTDVAAENPDVVARLVQLAERARADLGDALTKREATGAREPGRVATPAK